MTSSTIFRREFPLQYAIAALVSLSSLSFGVAAPLFAQQSGPVLKTSAADSAKSVTTSGDAGLIPIPVVVHDKHGALIQDLTKDQLQLWVDKKPAEIRSFERDARLPLTLGLLVDVGQSQRDTLDDERKASSAFFDTMLSASDTAFVAQFARQTDLLQDITNSRAKLHDGLQQLGTASPNDRADSDDRDDRDDRSSGDQNGGNNGGNGGGNNGGSRGSNGPYGRGGGRGGNVPVVGAARRPNSVLYDALFLSGDEVIAKQAGRKVLIVLSDGRDHGSKESLASAIEAAQRTDAVVYAIYIKGRETGKPDHSDRGISMGNPNQCDPYGPPGGWPGDYPPYGYPGGGYPGDCTPTPQTGSVESADARKMLMRITDQTGGRLFELDKKTTLADIYKQIGDEIHAQYRLTYAPDKDASSDGYHRIDISLKGDPKEMFVQTREGYFAGAPD